MFKKDSRFWENEENIDRLEFAKNDKLTDLNRIILTN